MIGSDAKRDHRRLIKLVAAAVAALSATVLALPGLASAAYPGLPSGSILYPGQGVWNTAHQFHLVMQRDCNLVLYNQAARKLWASNTSGRGSNCKAVMQHDGNLVVYLPNGPAVWASHTNGHRDAYARLQDDGNLVIKSASGSPIWATGTVYHKLYAPDYLGPGHALFSRNGKYKLINQESDGNVVLYNQQTHRALWATGTVACGSDFAMQRDGNLVDYTRLGRVCWSSHTQGTTNATYHLDLQSDGNLVIYRNSQAIWATNTQGR